jgi:two-component system sensor histidine kinase TctE
MQADLAQRKETDAYELRRSLQQIGLASVRATHTVNQLLSLARAETSGLSSTKTPCNLVQLAQDVIRDSVARALEKRIDLGYEGPAVSAPAVTVEGNALLISELVRNLVDNAINYTPSSAEKPGVITVQVLPETPDQGPALLVEDSGPGIAPADRDRVFQPFHRSLGTSAEGSGLGLSIVREIAHQHGAQVSVEDVDPVRPQPGARFVVRFPQRARHNGP